jgi:UDP-N-acetylmuramyl pentapeptide synthase
MRVMLEMFSKIPEKVKWIVLGDMLEQGSEEKPEHEKLANEINKYEFERIILMGPRISKYTLPLIKAKEVSSFENPKDVLEFIKENLKGGEIILFKGARFLEGVIENLLLNKGDAKKLARREKIWEIRRKKWGL